MRKLAVFLIIAAISTSIKAQTDPIYKAEIGASVGIANYFGDYNSSIVKNFQPAGSLIGRMVFNPHMALKFNATYLTAKGSDENVDTYYPPTEKTPYTFKNMLIDVGAVFECNFFPYGTGNDYRGAKRFTPYIFGGIGGTFAKTEQKNVFTANLPLGVGVKYKLNKRVNISLDWTVHFSLSDELDGMKDPYLIESNGVFKNADGYGMLQLAITYSFSEKCRTCHNEDF